MGEIKRCSIDDDLMKLADYLLSESTSLKDRIELYREFVENEWITIEHFNKLVLNERLGMLDALKNYVDLYGFKQ
jgi:hypothetical protein